MGLARLAEDVGGDDPALVLADVGQRPDAGDVADRPQARAGAQVCVDRNAAGVGDDADRLEADPVHARASAGGDEQTIAAQLAAVTQLQDVVPVASRGGHVRAEHELDPVAPEGLAERLAERRGLAWEEVPGTVDEYRLAAETADGLRHLDPDRPASEHEQPARHGLHAGRLTVRPHAVELAQAPDRAG